MLLVSMGFFMRSGRVRLPENPCREFESEVSGWWKMISCCAFRWIRVPGYFFYLNSAVKADKNGADG